MPALGSTALDRLVTITPAAAASSPVSAKAKVLTRAVRMPVSRAASSLLPTKYTCRRYARCRKSRSPAIIPIASSNTGNRTPNKEPQAIFKNWSGNPVGGSLLATT